MNGRDDNQAPLEGAAEGQTTGQTDEERLDSYYLGLAREAHRSSKSYMDTSLRSNWEKALALFNNRHPPGSKYHSEAYQKRSRLMRPKVRTAIRKHEAAAALALFSTNDTVHVAAVNESDPAEVMGAKLKGELLNYRLRDRKAKTFVKVMGGMQDALTLGVVASRQEWVYEERTETFEAPQYGEDGKQQLDENGKPVMVTMERRVVVRDEPVLRIIPRENLRFDPACDWTDPVRSSPYIIELIPMYVGDIRRRMEPRKGRDSQAQFLPVSDAELYASAHDDWDTLRAAREGNRVDKYAANISLNEFTIVWVHRNIMLVEGQDLVFYTLGTETMLSKPRHLAEEVWHGERDYSMGVSVIETHKTDPGGIALLGADLAEEATDLANLRIDNVRLALNKRYFVKRNAGVDTRALMRSVPGGGVLMNDPERDVKVHAPQDVTSSGYHEQDRINLDFDDLVGGFNAGTVQANRRLNETVGGMNLMSEGANILVEYALRTTVETWLEDALAQMVLLEQFYESDAAIIEIAASRAQVDPLAAFRSIGALAQVQVNVGFGSTNPLKRIEKMRTGLGTVFQIFPGLVGQADQREIVNEVFGSLGYKDGARWFPGLYKDNQDPRVAALEQQVQQLMAMVQGKQMEIEGRKEVAMITAQGRAMQEQIKVAGMLKGKLIDAQLETRMQDIQRAIAFIDAQIKVSDSDVRRRELWLQREALSMERIEMDREYALRMEEAIRGQQALAGGPDLGNGAANLKGEDKAGVISRERYGLVPGLQG